MTSPHLTKLPPGSAAHEAYMITEIRRQILRDLERRDLVSFMRVERGCLRDVARVLYWKVDQELVFNLDPSIERHKVYLGAVESIIVASVIGTPRGLKGHKSPMLFDVMGVGIYDPAVYKAVVPRLRRLCPALKRIEFPDKPGGKYGFSWAVHFASPPSVPLASATDDELLGGGHIYVAEKCRHPLFSPPPPYAFDVKTQPSPNGECVISTRFDLELNNSEILGRWYIDKDWMAALKDDPRIGDLHKSVDFNQLPVTLPLITSLFERQIAAGHADRLENITATAISSWTIGEFRKFARLASHSLSSLNLGTKPSNDVSFSDIPHLISIIRETLPNLRDLRIPLQYTTQPEAESKSWLSGHTLEMRGPIRLLRVYLSPDLDDPPFFNTLRGLSPVLAEGARVRLYIEEDDWVSGTKFLSYLRSQAPHRRLHLSTIDFPSLGVPDLHLVYGLTYHDDGRPRRRVETEAARWMESATEARAAPGNLFVDFSAALDDTAAVSAQLQRCTLNGNDEQTLGAMRQMLASVVRSVRTAREVGIMAAKRLDTAGAMQEEIERSIRLMEAAAAERACGDPALADGATR